MLSYAVLQAGARMHYAVPALLARAGALAAFYTDAHANHRTLALLGALPPRLQPKRLRRLLGRRLPAELPRERVHDRLLASLIGRNSDEAVLAMARRKRFGGATAIYTNFINNDLSLIEEAKAKGLSVVHELFISADSGRIMAEENRRYPGVEGNIAAEPEVESGIARDRRKWALSDLVLVPSTYCYESSVALGCDPAKLRIVPYGIPENWFDLEVAPEPGRLLCVGQVGLRKGHHILAEACRLLHRSGERFSCRVAGPPLVNLHNPLFEGPTYLGQVPRSEIQNEFRSADLFVMPTLTEGMALVHLEAMACGIPVITTPHCGSVVRDGVEGFIVPIRDSQTLAKRIGTLLADRPLRQRMGAAARERARDFTWRRYGERLLDVLP